MPGPRVLSLLLLSLTVTTRKLLLQPAYSYEHLLVAIDTPTLGTRSQNSASTSRISLSCIGLRGSW